MASAHAASRAVCLFPASSPATSSNKYQQRLWHSGAAEAPIGVKPQNDPKLFSGQDLRSLKWVKQAQRSTFALAPKARMVAAALNESSGTQGETANVEDVAFLMVSDAAYATPQESSVSPAAVQKFSLVARFYACFAPWRCKTVKQTAGLQQPGSSRRRLCSPLNSQEPNKFGQVSGGSTVDRMLGRAPVHGASHLRTAVGFFSTAGGGDFVTFDDGSQKGQESMSDRNEEGLSAAREGDSERPLVEASGSAEDATRRKGSWFLRIFGMEEQEEKVWKVPWTGSTIVQVMFLWFAAFWLVGSWAVPAAAHALGFNRSSFTYRGQAVYSLVTDLAEMLVGLGILMRCLARFRPRVAAGWFWFFPFKWRPGFWMLDTVAGCLLFPVVNMLSQINTELLPLPGAFPGGSPIEQSLSAKDPIANLLYVVVVSVCAPIWEEIIFRGFLLASLTRYMPMWGSVSVSALVFALAHFSLQRLLPLSFLGVVMGVIFVRSRNLLACMVLHSMWNAFVFLELLR